MVSTAYLRARLGTDWLMVQPVAMSVMVNVQVVLARREAAVVGEQLGLVSVTVISPSVRSDGTSAGMEGVRILLVGARSDT